jgi:predicted exporter
VPLTDSEVAEARLLLRSTHVQPYLAARGGSGRYAELTLLLRSADYRSIDGVWRAVHDIAPDLVPFGDGWNSYVMVSELVAHQAPGLAGTFAIDFLLLAFWFGAVGRAAIALAPVAVTLAVVFAGLAATGTPIGVANSMFAPVIFGVGTDFSIHLISARAGPGGDGAGAALARRAILTSTLAIGGGFSVLMLSDVLPTFQLGVMLAAGLAVACAATLVLVPALLASRAVHVSSCHEPSRSF